MANETPQTTAADTAPSSAPGIGDSLLGLADSILSNSTGQGAAMGGLLGYLLSQYGTPGGVNQGVDMAKQSFIKPRSTNVSTSRYVPFSQYGARGSYGMSPQLASSFGVPSGLGMFSNPPVSNNTGAITTQVINPNEPPSANFMNSMVPSMQSPLGRTFTSAGSGSTAMQNPTVTPRSTASLDPLTGALMGSAIGYLRDTRSTASGGTGGTGGTGGGGKPASNVGGALDTLVNAFNKYLNKPNTNTNTNPGTNQTTNPNDSNYNPNTNSNSNNNNTNSGGGYWTHPNTTDDDGDSSYYPVTNPSNNNNTNSGSGYNTHTNNNQGYVETYPTGNLTDNSATVDYYNLDQPMSNWKASTDYKDGGMATPLMAEGGEVPHYYTYGTAIDPQQIMQNMAQGGKPKPQGGLHVPTVEGRHDYRSGSRVTGEGDGQSDDIPAMLADGEYVFDADTVAQLGNGSTKAGSDLLDRFREEIRSHKRSAPVNKIPPPAKSPLAYLKAARSKKNG
jgi:hypothetical protein